MPLRATAFHEAISVSALEEIFKADANVLFAGTLATKCPKCGLRFAMFFPANDDPQNGEYRSQVEVMIANDCNRGKHVGTYSLTTTP
jgi:rRNA maturation protein Nop10